MLSGITASFPTLSRSRGQVTTRYSPLRHYPPLSKLIGVLVRLACLIHAANVHSEPGSNPSILYRFTSAAEASPGKIKFKPKVDSAPGPSVKDPSDSPFSFVLHEVSQVTLTIQPNSNLALLNSTEVSSPNCQRSVNREVRWFRLRSEDARQSGDSWLVP